VAKTSLYKLGQISDLEIKQLKIFKAVVDAQGFSSAETKLHIGRSTISTHISNLESRLNLRLCHRGRGGFRLTTEGEKIYKMTLSLLGELDEFRETVNQLNSHLLGSLRLLVCDKVSLDPRSYFPKLINDYTQQAPDVQLIVQTYAMTGIERKILNEEADIGIIPFHRPLEGLEYLTMYSDNFYLYAHKDHPLAKMTPQQAKIEACKFPLVHAGVKPNRRASSQLYDMNLAAIAFFYEERLALILSGSYIAFLPEKFVQSNDCGNLVRIAPDERKFHLPVTAIRKRSVVPNKSKDLMWELFKRQFKHKGAS